MPAGWCALWFVLVGSGYLHTLNLVPAGLCVLVVRTCWKWLPAYLEPRALLACVSLWFVLVGSGYLHALNLVPAGSSALLVGSDYLHTLNLVPAGSSALLVGACWK